MSSPIVSASDAGTRTAIKGISTFKGQPSQSCDLIIQLDRDFQLVCSSYIGNNLQYFVLNSIDKDPLYSSIIVYALTKIRDLA